VRLREALHRIVTEADTHLFRHWNWKTAAVSAVLRALMFFAINRSAGAKAAWIATGVEFTYRIATSGFFGSVTQVLRGVHPPWKATLATLLVLPAINQFLDFLVHWWQGTPKLAASILAASAVTAFASLFNLEAQRQGVLVVGPEARPFGHDVQKLPGVLLGVLLLVPRLVIKQIHR
jgi:hypothetical protein